MLNDSWAGQNPTKGCNPLEEEEEHLHHLMYLKQRGCRNLRRISLFYAEVWTNGHGSATQSYRSPYSLQYFGSIVFDSTDCTVNNK
jgi:hypothetical protein